MGLPLSREYLTHYDNITVGLAALGLVLDQESGFSYPGQSTGGDNDPLVGTAEIILIIATIVLGIMLAFTVITYCIRVTS